MFQNSRFNSIVEYFLAHDGYTDPAVLTRRFGISERTLRNDIREINGELRRHGAQIQLKRRAGYRLCAEEPEVLSDVRSLLLENGAPDYLDSADGRIHFLIRKLLYLHGYITQDDIADEVCVSLNTVFSYLKKIRAILAHYDLELQTRANLGYRIAGREADKRSCLYDLLLRSHSYPLQFTKEQRALLGDVEPEVVRDIIVGFNSRYDLHFSDYALNSLILQTAVSISRLEAGEEVLDEEPDGTHEETRDGALLMLTEELAAGLEAAFGVRLLAYERSRLLSAYASSKQILLRRYPDGTSAKKLVAAILDNIYDSYRIDLRGDEALRKDLELHLRAILSARQCGLTKTNPLLDTIRTNYILAYETTKTAVYRAFEGSETTLSEDEVGYIAFHIGAAIERYFEANGIHRKKVLVAYGSSNAEGSFLAAKLTSMFGDRIEVIGRVPSNELGPELCRGADLVVSSVPLRQLEGTASVSVQIPLRKRDFENITKIIAREAAHPVDTIRRFFSPALFLRSSAENRYEIIHQLCGLLEADGAVDEDFEMSVLQREMKLSTAMDDVLALPHPMQATAKRTGIAVGILNRPVKWSASSTARIIFLPAISEAQEPDMKLFYDTLTSIANNRQLEEQLLAAETLEEFLRTIKESIPPDAY